MTRLAVTYGSSTHATVERDRVLAALERIEHRIAAVERDLAALAPLSSVVAAASGGVAMVTDTVDDLAAGMQAAGIDLHARLQSTARVLAAATSPRSVEALVALLESKLLDPAALDVIGRLAVALADPGEHKPTGAWGLVRAFRDPDVQRAAGFLLAVARTFGRELAKPTDPDQRPSSAPRAREAP